MSQFIVLLNFMKPFICGIICSLVFKDFGPPKFGSTCLQMYTYIYKQLQSRKISTIHAIQRKRKKIWVVLFPLKSCNEVIVVESLNRVDVCKYRQKIAYEKFA